MISELGMVLERRKKHMSSHFRLSRILQINGLPCLVFNKFPKEIYEHVSSYEI
jgi:hypothetical protein